MRRQPASASAVGLARTLGVTVTITYLCNHCGYGRSMRFLPRAYELNPGRTVAMEQRHFWCETCGEISVGEALQRDPDILEMQTNQLRELLALANPSAEEAAMPKPHDRFRAEHAVLTLEEMKQVEADWQEWRRLRTAPQKCLNCGTTASDLPTSELSSFHHGGCSGTLVCTFTVGGFNGPAVRPHLYDANGTLIKQGSKPKRVPGQFQWSYEPLEVFCNEAPSARASDA